MGKPRIDDMGNCVECGRLIVPSEDDITKALLVLHNAGFCSITIPDVGSVYFSREAKTFADMQRMTVAAINYLHNYLNGTEQ
jgi:hypothetical protein